MTSTAPASRVATGRKFRRRPAAAFWALLGLVGLLAAANLVMGAVAVSPSEVAAVFARKLGFTLGDEPSFQATAVVWNIRVPRTVTGLVVGAGLGAAGAALQGLFRNPLADGQLLGLAPGAS
ncbi:MAG: iron chelate uptake ABC transporter family permease subunit, partial [Acidimicrobiia bacterium]